MSLYIKQKIFSLTDSYEVFDEEQTPVFRVQREFLSWGAKIHLYDMGGNELFFIKQKVMVLLPEYEIYKNNIMCAQVVKEFTFFKPRLDVSSAYGDFVLDGDFWDMSFSILHDGVKMGQISKAWLSWGDTYQLDIASGQDEAFFCALTIAIDNCLHNENHNN